MERAGSSAPLQYFEAKKCRNTPSRRAEDIHGTEAVHGTEVIHGEHLIDGDY